LTKKPFILLTTSRKPAKLMRTFCKDISHNFPNIARINRGKLSLEGTAEKALELGAEKVMIVERWKKGLAKIRFFTISEKGLDAVPPLIYIGGLKLRRDLREKMPKGRRIKSLAVASSRNVSLKVERIEKALSEFFNIPIIPFYEVVNRKCDAVIQISADQPNRIIITFMLLPKLVEIGPQIRISHLIWELPQ